MRLIGKQESAISRTIKVGILVGFISVLSAFNLHDKTPQQVCVETAKQATWMVMPSGAMSEMSTDVCKKWMPK